MKSRGEHLEKHYDQTFNYWTHIVPKRPPYVILCNFDSSGFTTSTRSTSNPTQIVNQLDELGKDFDWWWRRPGAAMMCLYRCSSDYYYKLRMVVIPPTAKGCFVFNIKKTWLKKPRKLEHAEIEELCRKWFVGNYSEYAYLV
jgi:hypothetical protein